MKTFQQFIAEMALNIGDAKETPLDTKKGRKDFYNISSPMVHHKYVTPDRNIEVQKHTSRIVGGDNSGDDVTEYHTNDHTSKETLHRSSIISHAPTKQLPFKHDEQTETYRENNNKLPKGYGTDFIYNHFQNSEHPLRSSDQQYSGGHKMWKKLAHKALDDGHKVYYHNGKELINSDKSNVDAHLNDYFGNNYNHENRHIILSKTNLQE